MTVLSFPGLITAVGPIAHFGDEKTGSSPILRSVQVLDGEGNLVRMPLIAGNAIRGHLRRLVIRDWLQRVGYEVTNARLYHALYSGGVLESTSETTGKINLDLRRQIRSTLIPLALLGTAIGNQMIDSSLRVGHAWPICLENKHRLPQELQDHPLAQRSIRTYTDTIFHTRRDDLRSREEDEQAVQMLIDFEVFIAGTTFYHMFWLEYPSDLEVACFGQMMVLWTEHPWIGGKAATGYGQVQLDYPNLPSPEPYLSFCEQRRQDILDCLQMLDGMLK